MMFDDDDMMFEEEEEIISDEEADIENRYYDAKCEMEENLDNAIEQFQGIVEDDVEKHSEWGYKALRKLCRHYAKISDKDQFKEYFKQYLQYLTVTSVSKVEKTIFLFITETSSLGPEFTNEVMEMASEGMKTNSNFSRIIFKIDIKRAQIMFEQEKYDELIPFLDKLIASCFNEKGKEDTIKSHLLVDLYGLQLQIYDKKNDYRKMQQICARANFSSRNISNPRLSASINFINGKVSLKNGNYVSARDEFRNSFKGYHELGNTERFDTLRYVILAHLLSGSKIDLFQDQTFNSYLDSDIGKALRNIFDSFHSFDIHRFNKTLDETKEHFSEVDGIKPYMPKLMEAAYRNTICKLADCFKRVKFSFLAKELDIEEKKVELIILQMIFDGTLKGKINQFDRHLVISEEQGLATRKYLAITELSKQLFSALTL